MQNEWLDSEREEASKLKKIARLEQIKIRTEEDDIKYKDKRKECEKL